MTATSRAFDLALFVGVPANDGDAVVITDLGPPFTAAFEPVVVATQPGVTVGASIPAAEAPDQILVSSSASGFPWELGTNPAVGATVPKPGGANHVIMSDATPTWQDSTLAAMLLAGSAVVTNAGATFTFDNSSCLAFTASATMLTRVNGGDPMRSMLDNFTIDCGTF